MELTKTHIKKIDSYIDNIGIRELDIKLELQDHIASILENEMFEDDEQSKMAFINYEIRGLVKETRDNIRSKSIHSLFRVFKRNLFTPHFFVVLFIACICFKAFQGSWYFPGRLYLIYVLVTPCALIVNKVMSSKFRSNNFSTKCMNQNSWLPLAICAGVGIVALIATEIIYYQFFGEFHSQIIGSIICSLSFGLYVKTLLDTFTTIPSMIKDEMELDELNYRLLTGLV